MDVDTDDDGDDQGVNTSKRASIIIYDTSRFKQPRQSVISSSDVTGFKLEATVEDVDVNRASDEHRPPLWMFGLIACGIAFVGLFCGVLFGMGLNGTSIPTTTSTRVPVTQPASSLRYIGQSCVNSSQCITSSYCDTTTSVCTCPPSFYYDSSVGACKARKTYSEKCLNTNECEFNELLVCVNDQCVCDSLMFWNSASKRCEDKRGLGETCIGVSNECYSSKMVCSEVSGSTSTRCICPLDSMYLSFFTGDCEIKKIHGVQCFANAHFECVDYAWCTAWPGDSTQRCTCIPSYYWDSTANACKPKKGYLSSCTSSAECYDNQLSLECISSRCDCPVGSRWNGTACNFQKPIGGPCTSNLDCLYPNSSCEWVTEQSQYQCMCPTGTYLSIVTSACVTFKLLGDVCKDTTECINNSTCLLQSSTSDMRCQCTASTHYQSSTSSCLFLKSINETCSSSSECQPRFGLFCLNGICTCDSNYYWEDSASECLVRKTYNSHTYNQFCDSPSECKTALGLTNCVIGRCTCPYPKTWNSSICL